MLFTVAFAFTTAITLLLGTQIFANPLPQDLPGGSPAQILHPKEHCVNTHSVIRDRFNPKDHYFVANAYTKPPPSTNLRRAHANYSFPIYDQGRTGSCTANAVTAALWYEENAGFRQSFWGTGGPSRLFVYWIARGAFKNNKHHNVFNATDHGAKTRNTVRGIAEVGVCLEFFWPFVNDTAIRMRVIVERPNLYGEAFEDEAKKRRDRVVNAKPTALAFDVAAQHKFAYYYRLDPGRPEDFDSPLDQVMKEQVGKTTLENLRNCLAEGFPVIFSFWFYQDIDIMFNQT
ncbi:uncharacterized protein KY384_004531 [Bacidia gigantensis]|uniref:uncharacterized protein n=1 Tax=Bacidia gigantensis TaxID=2732470 RepID=UPI001D05210D|nr:uncharacterized protein KY384_004531 [Bacidia gigantensis]KAG8531173.1 hypothetical protein KY384_004531 [Bacidia gigantensis]